MTGQVLPFVRPEFTIIIEITSHFFSYTTRKEIIKDALKAIEIVQTTLKRMHHFFIEVIYSLYATSPIVCIFVK